MEGSRQRTQTRDTAIGDLAAQQAALGVRAWTRFAAKIRRIGPAKTNTEAQRRNGPRRGRRIAPLGRKVRGVATVCAARRSTAERRKQWLQPVRASCGVHGRGGDAMRKSVRLSVSALLARNAESPLREDALRPRQGRADQTSSACGNADKTKLCQKVQRPKRIRNLSDPHVSIAGEEASPCPGKRAGENLRRQESRLTGAAQHTRRRTGLTCCPRTAGPAAADPHGQPVPATRARLQTGPTAAGPAALDRDTAVQSASGRVGGRAGVRSRVRACSRARACSIRDAREFAPATGASSHPYHEFALATGASSHPYHEFAPATGAGSHPYREFALATGAGSHP